MIGGMGVSGDQSHLNRSVALLQREAERFMSLRSLRAVAVNFSQERQRRTASFR